jgi:hypothetical protein
MGQRDTTTNISGPATTDAAASPLEGGWADVAEMARRLAPISPVRGRGHTPWRLCRTCSARRSGSIVGKWQKPAARRPRMAARTC